MLCRIPSLRLVAASGRLGGEMSRSRRQMERSSMKPVFALVSLGLALLATGGARADETLPPSPEARPVRTMVATVPANGEPVSLTGHIRARTEQSLAFRIDGRLIARRVDVGQI